jgi:hypothetical protein
MTDSEGDGDGSGGKKWLKNGVRANCGGAATSADEVVMGEWEVRHVRLYKRDPDFASGHPLEVDRALDPELPRVSRSIPDLFNILLTFTMYCISVFFRFYSFYY